MKNFRYLSLLIVQCTCEVPLLSDSSVSVYSKYHESTEFERGDYIGKFVDGIDIFLNSNHDFLMLYSRDHDLSAFEFPNGASDSSLELTLSYRGFCGEVNVFVFDVRGAINTGVENFLKTELTSNWSRSVLENTIVDIAARAMELNRTGSLILYPFVDRVVSWVDKLQLIPFPRMGSRLKSLQRPSSSREFSSPSDFLDHFFLLLRSRLHQVCSWLLSGWNFIPPVASLLPSNPAQIPDFDCAWFTTILKKLPPTIIMKKVDAYDEITRILRVLIEEFSNLNSLSPRFFFFSPSHKFNGHLDLTLEEHCHSCRGLYLFQSLLTNPLLKSTFLNDHFSFEIIAKYSGGTLNALSSSANAVDDFLELACSPLLFREAYYQRKSFATALKQRIEFPLLKES